MTTKSMRRRKRRLNSKVIKESDKRNKWDFLFFFLICILVSIPVLLYLMNRIEYVRYEYEIKELKQCRQKLQKDQKYLDLQKAALETPHLIEEKARRELSLISHDEGGHLVVVHFEHKDHKKEDPEGELHSELVAQKMQK